MAAGQGDEIIENTRMIRIIMDGREVEVEEGLSVLEAADKIGIRIPTLCYHPAIKPYGACRVCIVEMTYLGQSSKKRISTLTTSCTFPAVEGMEIKTNSAKVEKVRRLIVELLLARCPEVEVVKDLAYQLGLEKTQFPLRKEDCLLCGLCARVCKEAIGVEAISFINRSIQRKVTTPFECQSDVCLGCGACAYVCPAGIIKIEDSGDKIWIEKWHTEVKKITCKNCGKFYSPEPLFEHIDKKIMPGANEFLKLCPDCRKSMLANRLARSGA
jgi:NADH dehydrogenase/NADH:ubiquinone oxidoreductase subunit G